MAVTSGRIETGLIAGTSKFYFQWQQVSQNIAGDYTTINYQTGLNLTNGGYWGSNAIKLNSLYINTALVSSGGTWSNIGGVGDHELISGTIDIPHGTDGIKVFNASISGWLYGYGNSTVDGNWELTQIPRYANFTQYVLKTKGIDNVTIQWGADTACDLVEYNLNNGAWIAPVGDVYPIFKVVGLLPNTAYAIKSRIRRKDSGLWTTSGVINVTTHDIAKISTLENINFGDTSSLVITNPSSAKVDLNIKLGDTVIATRQNIGLNTTVTFSQAELDTLYEKMTNNLPVTLKYVLSTYKDTTIAWENSKDITCTMTGNAKTMWVNDNGTWKRGQVWVNDNGVWKRGVMWVNVNGVWKRGK